MPRTELVRTQLPLGGDRPAGENVGGIVHERFFDFLGEDGSKRLEAVCCDMWRSYVNAVRARAPQALIVFDKFHIVSHLGKAVDEVRREEIREKGQAHKDLVKNSRYLWLKNPWNLTDGQAERLATLVKLNTEVHRAYLLKEMFRRFWEYKRPGWAKRFLKLWCAWAMGTGLSPLRKFARTMLRPHGRHSQLLPRSHHQRCRGRHEQQGQSRHAQGLARVSGVSA